MGEISAINIMVKAGLSLIYFFLNLMKMEGNKTQNPTEKWAKAKDSSQKKKHKWPLSVRKDAHSHS